MRELKDCLKELHGDVYQAFDIHWMSWASHILSKNAAGREDMIEGPPPLKLIRFFKVSQLSNIYSCQQQTIANGAAISENVRMPEVVRQLKTIANNSKQSHKQTMFYLVDLEQQLTAQEHQCKAVSRLLHNLETATNPHPTALSKYHAGAVTNQ